MAMTMAARKTSAHLADSHMGGINTTPLIDIMLVLLVMFIITIPIQTHKVGVDLPVAPTTPGPVLPVNTIAITRAGSVLWNGTPVNYATLQSNLATAAAMSPNPELRFEPDADARFVVVDSVIAMIRRSGADTMGFIGNDRYANIF